MKIAQNFRHAQRRILIYTLDKYNLQTKLVSFSDHENLLKEVVATPALFYECQQGLI